jgi:hypothetical protein
MVLGWYRVPNSVEATTGSFVKIITYAGFITLDGTEMTFEETAGHVFSEAGFSVVNGRKLLGIYELIGLFNSIEEWIGLDVASGESKPGFGIVVRRCRLTVSTPVLKASMVSALDTLM